VKFTSAKLGEIEYDDEQVILFPEGLLGFPGLSRYALIDEKQGPFMWLQSLDEPSLALVVIDPWLFFPAYSADLPDDDVEALELSEPYNFSILCVATVPQQPRETTVNLMGPLVINLNNRKAKQVVLSNQEYKTRHRLFEEECQENEQ
jgi:flagellar assembly factor FliW